MLREAERKRRQRDAPSINLTSQSEIMADFERGLNRPGGATDNSFLLGLGLKPRTEDDEAL